MRVFTGWADSRAAAVQAVHEVYDAARAAAEAGRVIPHGGGRLVRLWIPARLGTRLARRNGRPLED
ncbi:hypothetical protein OG944_39105 (plasmid) [Streptomyces anulatus]|uniref:hypothetical protein n=1 Tax=Streptomyces anulatus TaxID=1892 RepID=UPI002F90A212